MRNVLDKSCRENQTFFSITFFFFENTAIFISKYMVEPEETQMTSQFVHTSCMLDKQGYTHALAHARKRKQIYISEYVILLASPQQELFTPKSPNITIYVHCLSCLTFIEAPALVHVSILHVSIVTRLSEIFYMRPFDKTIMDFVIAS
jgi:hypothetical protein